jgi:O-antigen ligase
MILPLLFFLTVNNIKDKKRMQWLVSIMVFIIFITGLYFFKNYRYIGKTIFREEKRISGTLSYLGPNEWGAFHAHYFFVILSIFLVDKLKIIKRILFILAILFSVYSILFSYSRGAYIALMAGLIFISLVKKRIFVIPLILFFIFWQSLLPPAVVQRINQTQTEEGELDHSAQTRINLWETGLDIFNLNPLLGIGFNTIPFVGLEGGFADTHNIYIKILAEQGLIGILIFLIILFLSLWYGWKLYKRADDTFLKGLGLGFVTCIIALMITNFFGDRWTYLPIGAYFWVFLGLVVRGNMIVDSEVKHLKHSKLKNKK